MYKIIDGKKIAQKIRAELCEKIAAFKKDTGRGIGLAVILVGENPALVRMMLYFSRMPAYFAAFWFMPVALSS